MLFLIASMASAQVYTPSPCEAAPSLSEQLQAGSISSVSAVGPRGVLAQSSSLRAPAGVALDPERARQVADEVGLALGRGGLATVARDLRSCGWGATQLVDGDRTTAWCEGAPGAGVGEVVLVPVSAGALQIRNGHAASAEDFAAAGRVREVEVIALGAGELAPVQGLERTDLPVLGRRVVELEDTGRWQPLPLPQVRGEIAFVALRIRSTTPGAEHTCLSDVRAAVVTR
jgi:hypothetical protein